MQWNSYVDEMWKRIKELFLRVMVVKFWNYWQSTNYFHALWKSGEAFESVPGKVDTISGRFNGAYGNANCKA